MLFAKNRLAEAAIVGEPKPRLSLLLWLVVTLATVFYLWFLATANDREMRSDLLLHARIAAKSIPLDSLHQLTGSEEDITNPSYARVKARLMSLRSAHETHRFLYLMGKKPDGKIFFYVDSEDAGSKDYSPPGQTYEEPTQELSDSFENGEPFTEGPTKDSWGVWISSLVPIKDTETNQVIAVMGMDVDAHEWVTTIAIAVGLHGGLIILFVFAIVAFAQILSKRREEERLKTLNQKLEAETDRANIMAREANRLSAAKSYHLANMSHEIRTPMNGIIGLTDLLSRTTLDEKQQHYVDLLTKSEKSLLDLLNIVLDLSKIEAGKLQLENISFNIADMVSGISQIMDITASAKKVGFLFDMGADIPHHLKGDPVRIRQVMINLIGNAIKFTEEGSVLARLILITQTENDVVIRFSVKDTGIGISPEAKERLFKNFSQADASTARQYGGTGLGLAISKELVSLMKGEIGVNSEEGKGSEFWFTMHLEKDRSGSATFT